MDDSANGAKLPLEAVDGVRVRCPEHLQRDGRPVLSIPRFVYGPARPFSEEAQRLETIGPGKGLRRPNGRCARKLSEDGIGPIVLL
jgi:hypothetical protein